jgi:hypothetical protein
VVPGSLIFYWSCHGLVLVTYLILGDQFFGRGRAVAA